MKTAIYKNTYGNGEVSYVEYLVADDGKQLTNGDDFAIAISVTESEGWYEIDAPASEGEDASEADYLAALNELGVSE